MNRQPLLAAIDILDDSARGLAWIMRARWYAPTERWTIVPVRNDIRLRQPTVRSPAFLCRSFFDPAGAEVKPTFLDDGKLMLLEVPPTHRGAVWSLDKAKCPNEPLRMLNVPGTFAFDPASLIVPRDAIE